MDVERIIEELYRLNPGDFVAARDAYVAEARKAGDTSAAKAIAALRRPTRATWAANLLAHERPDEAGQLVELGRTLREAHRTLDAPQLRAAGHQRHQLVAALAREAAGLARSAGLPIGDTVVHEVEQILHTVLADPEVAEQWSRGRLTAVPDAVVGFMGVPAPAVPPPSPPRTPPPQAPARTPPPAPAPSRSARRPESDRAALERRRERLERARAAAAEADAEARRREEGLREAREEERAAEAAATEAAERVRALERELQGAHRAERASRAALTEAASAVKEAERATREARRAAERAARSLERVEGREEES
ncbi:hypothetical protein ACF06X_13445 [Streptomyces sp. NPDC015346]|uniref:hypothetical protein n=1 Tax=Streptomyces sp. NPDC015346 TaxID=3364954 RepID=UPI0036F886DA